jgi:hypothetical protein
MYSSFNLTIKQRKTPIIALAIPAVFCYTDEQQTDISWANRHRRYVTEKPIYNTSVVSSVLNLVANLLLQSPVFLPLDSSPIVGSTSSLILFASTYYALDRRQRSIHNAASM